MRCCTSLSCPWLICQNTGPQTGMSRFPWAVTVACPRRILITRSDGNLPELLLARSVKSRGVAFSAGAAGPSPLAVGPWQEEQYDLNISLPDAAEVAGAGTRSICGLVS